MSRNGLARTRVFGLCLLLAGSFGDAAEPNDSWAEATDVGLARRVADRIDFSTPGPDTALGLFDGDGELLLVDEDSSFFGNGLASAVTGWPVNDDGSIRFAVSGTGDYDFDGLVDGQAGGHTETGDFLVLLTIRDAAGRVIDSRDLDGTLAPGEAIAFPPQADPAWIGGSFDLELSNFFGPASDADFWAFTGAPPGAPFIAEIVSAQFDTLLAWYDDAGNAIGADDDGGAPPLSRIEGITPASGAVYLAVTAYPDFSFTGVHSADGDYTLRLFVAPEPGGAAFVAAALIPALTRRRRRSP